MLHATAWVLPSCDRCHAVRNLWETNLLSGPRSAAIKRVVAVRIDNVSLPAVVLVWSACAQTAPGTAHG